MFERRRAPRPATVWCWAFLGSRDYWFTIAVLLALAAVPLDLWQYHRTGQPFWQYAAGLHLAGGIAAGYLGARRAPTHVMYAAMVDYNRRVERRAAALVLRGVATRLRYRRGEACLRRLHTTTPTPPQQRSARSSRS